MPLRVCSICSRPDALEITKFITAGGSKRQASDRFKVSASAVQRHKVKCLRLGGTLGKPASSTAAPILKPVVRSEVEVLPPETDAESLLRKAERLLGDVQEVLNRAKMTGNDRVALLAAREIRSSIELVLSAHEKMGGTSELGRLLNALNDRDDDGPTRRVEFVIAPDTRSESEKQQMAPTGAKLPVESVPQPALESRDVTDNRTLPTVEDTPETKPQADRVAPDPEDDHWEPLILGGYSGSSFPIGYNGRGTHDAIRSIFGK